MVLLSGREQNHVSIIIEISLHTYMNIYFISYLPNFHIFSAFGVIAKQTDANSVKVNVDVLESNTSETEEKT